MLTDDQGHPLFADEGPAPEASPPVEGVVPEPVPEPAAVAPPVAAPDTTALEATGVAEPPAASPDQPSATPPPPDWDDDANPYKAQALAARRQAEAAQAAALQQRAAQRAQQKALLQAAELRLAQQVGNLTPEQIQQQMAQIAQARARFDHEVEAERGLVDAHVAWNRALAQARTEFGLSDQDVARLNQTARDTDDLWAKGSELKADREQRTAMLAQVQTLSHELTQLRRSQQAAQVGRANVAGGTHVSPAATTVPNSPLAQLRMAVNGDPNRPVRI